MGVWYVAVEGEGASVQEDLGWSQWQAGLASPGSRPLVHSSFQLQVQAHHAGCLKSGEVGVFTLQEVVNFKPAFFLLFWTWIYKHKGGLHRFESTPQMTGQGLVPACQSL